MKNSLIKRIITCAALSVFFFAIAQASTETSKESRMNAKATGPFEVKRVPQPADSSGLGRFTLDKQYHGELEATAQGEMLAARTATQGSAGYVAIEKVTGKLGDRSGTFLLQHSGLMNRGEGKLSVTVIPDSGTDALTGLSGTMDIKITTDGHFYEFDYSLPEKK
jgi:hypothetical protein